MAIIAQISVILSNFWQKKKIDRNHLFTCFLSKKKKFLHPKPFNSALVKQ